MFLTGIRLTSVTGH